MTSVLVTGGAGYIGSHAAKALKAAGYNPVTYDNLGRGHRQAVQWGPLVEADLGDRAALVAALRDHAIEAVLHFAAFAYVGESMTRPELYFENNVVKTLGLLDAMREVGVRNLVFSSTCATYGNPDTVPITEETPQHPVNAYGETKLMIEQAMRWYGEIHGMGWVALRYFNAAGADGEGRIGEAHEPETHLIPLVLDAASGRRPAISVFGTDYPTRDGTCIRDYIHVDDLADAHVKALDYLRGGGRSIPINLGTGEGHTVNEVIAAVERVTGLPVIRRQVERREGDPPALVADAGRAADVLGWQPTQSDLDTIVRTAWTWHQRGVPPHIVTPREPADLSRLDTLPLFEAAGEPLEPAVPVRPTRARVEGKFFFADDQKLFLRGVTYGPFAPGEEGRQFPDRMLARRDFAAMAAAGVNTVRVFTVPPVWLLDLAGEAGLRVLAGIPWSQHVTFLDDKATMRDIRRSVQDGVRSLMRHDSLLAVMVGNEIPPDMIRWHGVDRVRAFLKAMIDDIRDWDERALVSYANYPSTEYLTIDFIDFVCFNVYLHDPVAFRRYVARLHNLAVDRPLVLTEFGMDSMRNGTLHQAETLGWQVHDAYALGCAGTCVFAWTDEWFTGGHLIEDWAFGLVDRDRTPKPALESVSAQYLAPLPPPLLRAPSVSVVVCAYNAERTMEDCLASLEHLNYPDYEVIVVNDGSTDRTRAITEAFPYCRLINQDNKGLSVARNVGAEAATGEIVVYTDSDCVADRDWLHYLIGKMVETGRHAVGGPNFPPPENSLIPAAVAVSPGGPTHVLVSDEVAEHIAGCNMAFRRDVLLGLGGFDATYRTAGDDVDICWRFQNAGHTIGFAPAAVVWHYRRNTVGAYLNQQRGYGKAEALVYSKHPLRFNLFGQAKWLGRIYGDLSASLLLSRKPLIYAGALGRGLFQTLYEPPSSLAAYLPLSFEWNIAAIPLALIGLVVGGWGLLLSVPLLTTWTTCIFGAFKAPIDPRFRTLKARGLIALLIYLGPIVRGWTRLKWRIRESEVSSSNLDFAPVQRPRIDWRDRTMTLSYWGEQGEDKDGLIGGLIDFLAPRKYFVQMDEGWNDWDLRVARGLWSRARLLVSCENHGGSKRVLRVRCSLRLSRLALFCLRSWVAITALSLALNIPVLAILFGALSVLHSILLAQDLVGFGRVMHRVLDGVAVGQKLIPMTGPTG